MSNPLIGPGAQGIMLMGAATCALGTAVSGVSLWGGRKILQQADESNKQSWQNTLLKIAGYALIAFGVLAGLLACASLSFALAPLALSFIAPSTSLCTLKIVSYLTFAAACSGLGYATYRACKKPM